jgi:3alpha(or 20beta)-hydroxysteroid dehydrogenase
MISSLKIPTFLKEMEDRMDRLRGKVILISGGARGQGAAEARLFVAEGARVVIGDVLEPEGRHIASELGDAAMFLRQDVTQEGIGKGR